MCRLRLLLVALAMVLVASMTAAVVANSPTATAIAPIDSTIRAYDAALNNTHASRVEASLASSADRVLDSSRAATVGTELAPVALVVAAEGGAVTESAWVSRRLHTLEVRMEHDDETPGPEEVPA